MTPLRRTLLGGAIAVVVFDALASFAALWLGFDYSRAAFGSWLVYAGIGFVAARVGGLPSAVLAGVVMGLVDATVGWAISWAIGPGRPPGGTLSVVGWVVAAFTVVAGAACVGLLGGMIGRLTVARTTPTT